MSENTHICHVSLVHRWNQGRIFQRMCVSLAKQGYQVTLVVPTTKERVAFGVRIIPAKFRGRLARIFLSPLFVFSLRKIPADIFHFHDPALLPWMGLFRFFSGAKVIYDVHEYFPEALVDSNFFKFRPLNFVASYLVRALEPYLGRRLDGVIGVTEPITNRFKGGGAKVLTIRNLVDTSQLPQKGRRALRYLPAEPFVMLGGTINATRAMEELVLALGELKRRSHYVKLICAGQPFPPGYVEILFGIAKEEGVEKQIQFLPRMSWRLYQEYLSRSRFGLVLYREGENNSVAIPNRLYEAMANGLPLIVSDFPLLRSLVERFECGVVIERTDPIGIADAMEYLLGNPDLSKTMGDKGRKPIEQGLCWEKELDYLKHLYRELECYPR